MIARAWNIRIAVYAIAVLSCLGNAWAAENLTPHGKPPAYSTPQDVFNACSEAAETQDWRKAFFCHTAEAQDKMVFEAYYITGLMSPAKYRQGRALLQRYGADDRSTNAEFIKQYAKKTGIQISSIDMGELSDEERYPFLQQVVCGVVTDKVGFWREVNKLWVGQEKGMRMPELRGLVIEGETASGYTTEIREGLPPPPPGIVQTLEERTLKRTFQFRKVNGTWLIDRTE